MKKTCGLPCEWHLFYVYEKAGDLNGTYYAAECVEDILRVRRQRFNRGPGDSDIPPNRITHISDQVFFGVAVYGAP